MSRDIIFMKQIVLNILTILKELPSETIIKNRNQNNLDSSNETEIFTC